MKNGISPYLEVLVTFMMGSLKSTEGVQVRKLTVFVYHLGQYTVYWYMYIDFDLQWVLWTVGFSFLWNYKDTLQRRWGPSCHLQWRRPMWWGRHFSRRWRWGWGWWRPKNPRVRNGWFFVLFAQWVFCRINYIFNAHCASWMYSSKPSQWVVTVNFHLLFRIVFFPVTSILFREWWIHLQYLCK